MFKKTLYPTLIIPIFFLFFQNQIKSSDLLNEKNPYIEKKYNQKPLNINDIPEILEDNNFELKALKNMIKSASFNFTSSLGKRYPSVNLNATGLPQYVYGKTYNSSSVNTKTSQFKVNPALTIRWDLINATREPEINSAQNNLKIAINNYEIKKNDLIQEAKSRFHAYQKSFAEVNNSIFAVDLSKISLKDAQSKLEAGTGTEFDVLEAKAQLSRDIQLLEEKKTSREINKIALKEILNINFEKKLKITNEQKLLGFWNFELKDNVLQGVKNSFSLKNLNLQSLIKDNQAKSFKNSNKPVIYISNTISNTYSKGSTLSAEIDAKQTRSNYSNTISLNFAWNIFDGGQNKNSSKAREAESKADKFNYRSLENSLKKNISETYLNLKKFEKKIISTNQEKSSTKESLRLARLRYEAGVSTMKDVLTRQKELSNANLKNINSIYNYNINLNKLERLTFEQISTSCLINKSNNKSNINPLCNY